MVGGSVTSALKTHRYLQAAGLALLVSACVMTPSGPPLYGSPYGSGRSGKVVDALSQGTRDSAAFNFYTVSIDAPYTRVFRATVSVLNDQGDPVVQADSDKGYIVTAQAAHGVLYGHHRQYFVGFDRISDQKTEMTVKLFDWNDVDTDDPRIAYLQADQNDFIAPRVSSFIEAVRAAAAK